MIREVNTQELKKLINEARPFISKCDWAKLEYSKEKAAFGAMLSQIAYCSMDKDEFEASTRAKLVPSEMFQRIIASRSIINVSEIAREEDFPIEIVRTATLIAAIVRQSNLVLIAIRGTQFMYELKIDAQIKKWFLDSEQKEYFLHDGFLKDAKLLSARLHRSLASSYASGNSQKVKICVFGHSLGGAVAAILKFSGINEIENDFYYQYISRNRNFSGYSIEQCYTYGAPRAASERICRGLRTYAVRREGDVIPFFPAGYAEYLEQYSCKGINWRGRDATLNCFQKLLKKIRFANAYSQHLIDGYKKEIIESLIP